VGGIVGAVVGGASRLSSEFGSVDGAHEGVVDIVGGAREGFIGVANGAREGVADVANVACEDVVNGGVVGRIAEALLGPLCCGGQAEDCRCHQHIVVGGVGMAIPPQAILGEE
jgi:hypothetical protein